MIEDEIKKRDEALRKWEVRAAHAAYHAGALADALENVLRWGIPIYDDSRAQKVLKNYRKWKADQG